MDKFPSRERSAAATTAPRVTAIVVAHQLRMKPSGQTPFDLCLRSAVAEPSVDALIIVDLDNQPEVSSALRAFQADRRDVTLLTAPKGVSVAAAANLGAQHAREHFILFLDPHVVLQRGAVARLINATGGAHTPWIVGGRLTDTDGRDRRAARTGALKTFSAIALAMDLPGPKQRTPRRRKTPSTNPTRVGAVSGAFMLMPRSDFLDLRGFDEAFAGYAADLDLCRRAAERGGSVLFQPSAAGVQLDGPGAKRRKVQGLALFASRSAKTPLERAFAAIAKPALMTLVLLKDFVVGRPPERN